MADSKIFVLHAREVNGAPHDAPPVYGDATEMVRVLELWMSCSRPPRSIVVMPCFAEQQWPVLDEQKTVAQKLREQLTAIGIEPVA